MLTLPIKRKWYEMIVSGEKPEEYREPSEYWLKRLRKARYVQDIPYDYCGLKLMIRSGYSKDAPLAIITLSKIDMGPGLEAWGAEPGHEYLRLHIREVTEINKQQF